MRCWRLAGMDARRQQEHALPRERERPLAALGHQARIAACHGRTGARRTSSETAARSGATAIAAALETHQMIQSIDLSRNIIGHEGGLALAKALLKAGSTTETEQKGKAGFITVTKSDKPLKLKMDGNVGKVSFIAELPAKGMKHATV